MSQWMYLQMVCLYLEEKCYRAGEQLEIPAYLGLKEFAVLGLEGLVG